MQRSALCGLILLIAIPQLSLPLHAHERGKACNTLSSAEKGTTWWGRFSGGREMNWSFDSEGIEYFTDDACFSSRKACERWLYELKSEYGYMPRWNDCSKGYHPGKPIKPW